MTVDLDTVHDAGARLATAAARLSEMGWMRGTSGNLSEVLQRDPLLLAVTASGVDKGELDRTAVVVVDELGAAVPVEGLAPNRPSAEAALHALVAAHTGAGAVVHVHAMSGVVAAERWPTGVVLHDLEMLKGIGRRADDEVVVPVIMNSQSMAELGERFVAAHDAAVPAVLVARHGMYAWGATIVEARHHAEALEWALGFAVAVAPSDGGIRSPAPASVPTSTLEAR